MLPPGWPRLAATPSATGSALLATMTSGMLFVALRAASSGAGPTIRITSARRAHQPGDGVGQQVLMSAHVREVDDDVAAVDVSVLAQSRDERGLLRTRVFRLVHRQDTDAQLPAVGARLGGEGT